LDNSGGNKLYNSDFETFTTSNVPDNWIIATGTAGTHIFASGSTDAYTGSNALKITGDAGSTLSTVRQTFATTPSTTVGSGGTSGTLTAGEQYAVNGFVKVSAAPAAGVLRIRLVDGSNNVINDDSGTANSFTVSLTTQTTSYAAFNGTFRIPSVLPTTIKLEVGLSTAIDSGKSLYIDDLALTPMVSLYSGGPSFAAFASSTKVAVNDMWTLTTTNTMGGFAVWMERFFGMRDRGLQLAYSGTNAISDTLIA
jgi:hypothetical protein